MPMKPYAQERAESGQATFSAALKAKEEEEDYVEEEVLEEPLEEPDDDDIEVYVSDEDEEPEEKEPDSFERLADLLTQRQQPVVPVEEAVPERAPIPEADMAAIRKKFDDKLHEVDNPSELLDEYANALVGGALAKQNLEIQKLKKDALKADPDKRYILETYEKDVERVISSLPANQQTHPDAYDYAVNQVMLKKMPELKQHWIDEAKPKKAASTRPGKTKTARGGGQGGTSNGKVRVRATKRDEAMARAYGMSVKAWLKRSGKIK